ncbi:MAG: diacylglycerol kinase family protein, partial [Solirubrobacteraceae bacterium]|nr:diacylglycerol kinase family protein [Solirubrobacteraceae bacterium]
MTEPGVAAGERSFVLIANPTSGRGQAAEVVARVTDGLRAGGAPVRSELTTSIEHADGLAQEAARVGEVAVAVGG